MFIVVRVVIFMIVNAMSFSGVRVIIFSVITVVIFMAVNVIISSVSELNNPSLSTSHSQKTATMASCDLIKFEW